MIYISTGGFRDQSAWKTSTQLKENGMTCIELSGGLPDSNQLTLLSKMKTSIKFQLHNYFPPPLEPFVFNLASLDSNISLRSFHHVKLAMEWALELDNPVYSFHAGFLLDPKVDELGKRINNRKLYDRELSTKIFIEQLNKLSDIARVLGVALLVENNVLSANNYKEFSENPFLMATADECAYVMGQTPDNINLLIDLAHLKVSSQSLGLDSKVFLEVCKPWINGYHMSDNDGKSDSNSPVKEDSWFWPYIKKDLTYYTLEIYGHEPSFLLEQQRLAEKKIYGKVSCV